MEKELNCHGLKNNNNKKNRKKPTTHQKTVTLAINWTLNMYILIYFPNVTGMEGITWELIHLFSN